MTLFAEYTFEEGGPGPVLDTSGNGRDLTVQSGSYVAPGKDSSFGFQSPGTTSSNGAIRTMTNPTAAATLMCWVNPASVASGERVIAVWANGGSSMLALFMRRTAFGPTGVVQANIRIGGTITAINMGDSAPADTWTHLAVTYDGTTARTYINGVPSATLASAGTIGTAATFAVAGYANVTGPADLIVDDVRVFDAALTQGEIQAIVGDGETVTLAGTLPALEGSFEVTASADIGLSGVLSALTGSFEIDAGGEPAPPSYLSITVGPLRDPLQVDTMREPLLVGTASGELVTVGALVDTAPIIGELRDEQSPIIGELRDPLAVDEMREPVTIDELRE